MAKIPNDKYYTPQHIVDKCVNKVKEVVADNVTEIIEPSAGNGAFIESLDNNFNCDKFYFDLIPEHDKIKQQDFLELDLEYKQGRVVIGNPPFGTRSTLIVKFFKKSVQIADYVAFILPISQLNNTKQLYEFDLVYSEDLGKQEYSGVNLHCCFNIYKRPSNGILNNKPKLIKIDGLEVIEYRRDKDDTYRKNIKEGYFHSICCWGASLGKCTNFIGEYSMELYFYSDNGYIKNVIKTIDWKDEVCNISTKKIPKGKALEIIQEALKRKPYETLPR